MMKMDGLSRGVFFVLLPPAKETPTLKREHSDAPNLLPLTPLPLPAPSGTWNKLQY